MTGKTIFIVGTGRCGTTWLNHWLLQHPLCYGGSETQLFCDLHDITNRDWTRGLKTWMSRKELINCCNKFVLDIYSQNKKASQIHVVDQSHQHYWFMEFIEEILPNSYFIHIYRDGRNVVESWLRVPRRKQWNPPIDKHINDWIEIMSDMLNRQTRPNHLSILDVKYEDLIQNPQQSRQITEFIGIDHHEDIDPWSVPVNTPFSSYDYNRWQSMPPYKIKQTEKMNPILKRLGYSCDGYYRLKPMNRHDVIEQLMKIGDYIPLEKCIIHGSAALVLNGEKECCKDIDLACYDEVKEIDLPYKTNITSRFYSKLRLDISFWQNGVSQWNTLQSHKINKITDAITQNYHNTTPEGYRALNKRGVLLSAWLFCAAFTGTGILNEFEKSKGIELTDQEIALFKQNITPELFDKMLVRIKHIRKLYEKISRLGILTLR